ncbi:MAG: hypothetical protein VXW51_04155 [Pseudomonadota bacterium]|nr:hypothetical protein [Pseudomonadota bacterium]
MNKNFFTAIIFSLILWNSSVYAEEIRSRFGFYITVPTNFIALQNQNMDDLLKKYEGSQLDKDAFNDIMAGVSKQNMNIEFFFPTHMNNPEDHSININVQKGDIKEISSIPMSDICPMYKSNYSKVFKKNIKQYSCKLTKKFSPKFSPAIFLYHDGASGYLVQYQIQTSAGLTTFTAGCNSKKTCELMDNYTSQMIRSIR